MQLNVRSRVEGLLRETQATAIRPISDHGEHAAQLLTYFLLYVRLFRNQHPSLATIATYANSSTFLFEVLNLSLHIFSLIFSLTSFIKSLIYIHVLNSSNKIVELKLCARCEGSVQLQIEIFYISSLGFLIYFMFLFFNISYVPLFLQRAFP